MSAPIAVIRKNATEEVRIVLGSFNGHDLVHVRVYSGFPDTERVPTKRGIAIRVEQLSELIAGLRGAEAMIRAATAGAPSTADACLPEHEGGAQAHPR